MPTNLRATVDAWAERPDISARSVLVTVFGDTILPVTTSFWLAQLFQLTEALGFNDRLVRTSMFRLAAEAWLTNERIGRESRYSLTPLAVQESEQASKRIYDHSAPDWSGTWTLVMLDGSEGGRADRDAAAKHLSWHGFIPLGSDLLVSPTDDPASVDELFALIGSATRAAVASATFVDLDRLVGDGFFDHAFNTPAIEEDYRTLIERFEALGPAVETCSPLEAFAVRTMLIHDLRRIRLRSPDIPSKLLPPVWAGSDAHQLAGELYATLSERCADALSAVLDVDYPSTFPNRFPISS